MNQEFKRVLESIKSGEMEKTEQISHVAYYMVDKTPYSFHFYAVYARNTKEVLTEFLYDLRNKEYFIMRNGKEVNFNVANLDTVIPRTLGGQYSISGFNCRESISKFFAMVSVEENKGMYAAMLNAVGSIGDEKVDMTSRALIRLITDYNKLELLYKAGIDISAMSKATFRGFVQRANVADVRKIHEIFGLTKPQFKFMSEFTSSSINLAELAHNAKHLTKLDMDSYRAYMNHIQELEDKYGDKRLTTFTGRSSFDNFIDAMWRVNTDYGAFNDRDFYGFVAKYKIANPYKLIEYLLFECYNSQGIDFSVAFSEYNDYYRMCTELEYVNFTKYPRFLRTYHDIVTRNYTSVLDELLNKKFAAVVEQHKDLETTIGDFAIVVPTEAKELVTEGNVLHHCVGGYIRKVVNGDSLIVFLREKEKKEEPLVTVEIRGKAIVQALGTINRFPTAEEKDALKKFAKRKDLKLKSFV